MTIDRDPAFSVSIEAARRVVYTVTRTKTAIASGEPCFPDCHCDCGDYEVERSASKTFLTKRSAYRQAAAWAILNRGDERYDGGHGCNKCSSMGRHLSRDDEERKARTCKYHGGPGYTRLLNRFVRWLMWRDRKAQKGATNVDRA